MIDISAITVAQLLEIAETAGHLVRQRADFDDHCASCKAINGAHHPGCLVLKLRRLLRIPEEGL